MTQSEFIRRVVSEVTEDGAIPIAPKEQRIKDIIKTTAKYFWENDDECVEFEYIIISDDIKNTPLFLQRRQIQLPECVEAVEKLHELGSWINSMDVNPDFRKTNFNYHMAVVGDSDSMVYGVVAGYYADFMRNFIVRTVAYDYNPFTHMLAVRGRDQFKDLVAASWVHINMESLFEMDRFFKYVCGKCMISFAKVFGLVDAKAIGALNINVRDIKSDGQDLIKKVEADIKDQRSSADFMDEF